MIFSPRPFNSTWASLQRYFSLTFSFHNLQHILKRTHSDCLCAVLECGNCTQHNVQGFLALGLQQDVHLECLNTKAHTRTTGLWSPCCTFELSWCDRRIWMWWLGVDHRNISTINKLECLSSIQIYGKCKLAAGAFLSLNLKGTDTYPRLVLRSICFCSLLQIRKMPRWSRELKTERFCSRL